ncbi:putative nuclease HARBI1 [Bufo gargarizans]|uniref:putative nuclease HARBI1 n=1 Tax=Bufo gargarizans TaxID=30331 RepID=UPI001CF48F20|nr:putative nuclease HARBI1 [Bufo gargarizans]
MADDSEEEVLLHWLISRRWGQRSIPLDDEPSRRRRLWVHPIVSQRYRKGHFHTFYADLRQHPEKFFAFCRMSVSTFDCLLSSLRTALTFMDTNMRRSITPEERLIVTLRFLATGNSFASLHFEFLLGTSTISRIVHHTCHVIWQQLRDTVMPQPKADDWFRIAEGFNFAAQFPNCIGAMDGKHIRVKKPPHSGSRFFKQYFSVVVMAVADSNYRFIMVDIGTYGSTADARVFSASRMGERLRANLLALPESRRLAGYSGPPAPFVIVADEGFALTHHVMRPFPKRGLDLRGRIFNYRLTRARRYVECAFGILSSKWRVFLSSIQMDPENATLVIQACVVLHNFTRIHEASSSVDMEEFPTSSVLGLDRTLQRRPGTAGIAVRELYADYFFSPEGSLPWQMDAIRGSV